MVEFVGAVKPRGRWQCPDSWNSPSLTSGCLGVWKGGSATSPVPKYLRPYPVRLAGWKPTISVVEAAGPHLRLESRCAEESVAMGTEDGGPGAGASVRGEARRLCLGQLLGGRPPVALHSSAGERPRGPVPTEPSPHDAHAVTARGAPRSAPLHSLLSPGRSWETPASCPEKPVGREGRAGAQLSCASEPGSRSSQAPCSRVQRRLRKVLLTARPAHLPAWVGRGPAPSLSFS